MRRRAASAAILLLALAAGCGAGERTFTPEEFVEAINSEGAGIALGSSLTTTETGVDVRTLAFTELSASDGGDTHGGGTLVAVADVDTAREEFARCSQAPSLICFRAANVVLRFEGLQPADEARLASALEAMETIE